MIDKIILASLHNRISVLVISALLLIYGTYTALTLPIDVLPNLNRPVVSILTEAPGLAPEEIEAQISFPIESVLNGGPGVHRVRSASIPGLSIVWIDFDWDSEVYQARQIVAERLQQVSGRLPPDTHPILGPISSIMGEIMLIGLTADSEQISALELRELADWTLRPRLLAISGVSQISVIGGEVKQYQVKARPQDLIAQQVSLLELENSLKSANNNASGGYIIGQVEEQLTRTLGRFESIADIEDSLVHRGVDDRTKSSVIQVKHLADVEIAGQIARRGDAGINGQAGVILTIQKQPGTDTISLTKKIHAELDGLSKTLPEGVRIHDNIFQQSRFIKTAVGNVKEVLRDGAILVTIVLFLFLLNFRTTLITLTAIPLSITISLIFFRYFGLSINTMTLGGLAIAIGELVDDAIVDVENIFRRLRENARLETPRPILEVVYLASREIRGSIAFATLIVVLVFIPLFALSGIEGRLFLPIGFAYVSSILGSLLVALTLTPVLSYYFLPGLRHLQQGRESLLIRILKSSQKTLLTRVFSFPRITLSLALLLFLLAAGTGSRFGREFLPAFNEGAFTVNVLMPPGTSLKESNRIGVLAEQLLRKVPEISLTGRRVGRAENDEHAQGVHSTEIEGEFSPSERSRSEILSEMRSQLKQIPGVSVNVGQPISHRIDHLLSGVRSQLAIKVFGADLSTLRSVAEDIRKVAAEIPGIVDLYVEKQVLVPQVHIRIDRQEAALLGLTIEEISHTLETALNGRAVTQIIEEQRSFDVVLRLSDDQRNNTAALSQLPITLHNGSYVPLGSVASIEQASGPNAIARENVSRRIVISANVSGVDLVSTVEKLQQEISSKIEIPENYFVSYGGQFESQASASKLIFFLGAIALLGIFLILYYHYRNLSLTLQVMLAVPFAFIGAIFGVAATGATLSIASLVGFITLTGIATRNGIMMIDHYLHLIREEHEELSLDMIFRGSAERLVPVLMTTLTAILALTPILIGGEQSGKEILYPVAVVVFSGLFSSTTLNLLITPLIFWKLGQRSSYGLEPILSESSTQRSVA